VRANTTIIMVITLTMAITIIMVITMTMTMATTITDGCDPTAATLRVDG